MLRWKLFSILITLKTSLYMTRQEKELFLWSKQTKRFTVFCIQQYAFYDNSMYTLSTLDLFYILKKMGIYIIHELSTNRKISCILTLSQDKLSWGTALALSLKLFGKRNRELNKIKHLSLREWGIFHLLLKSTNTIDKVKLEQGPQTLFK